MRGTLLNTATVAVGASLGLLAGSAIPNGLQEVALGGIGLVTLALGMKSFMGTKNVLVVTAAVVFGGLLGGLIGLANGLEHVTEWVRGQLGGGSHFNEGLIGASLLFCIGPLTLLGCIEDGAEGKIELLSVKSTLDGVAALFLAAGLGRDGGLGVLLSALFVLLFQGTLTLSARPLRRLVDHADVVAELSATGGILLMAIGLGLLEVVRLPVADYLPALLLAPGFAAAAARLSMESRSDLR